MVAYCPGSPTRAARYVAVLTDDTVMIFAERCAQARSAILNSQFASGESDAAKEIEWAVCTITGTPDRRAAMRPITPAFALWVWTMSYRSLRIRRCRAHVARTSAVGVT